MESQCWRWRSTIAALVIGLVITTVERLFRFFAPMLEPFAAGLIGGLYQAPPGYHLANVAGWITEGQVLTSPSPPGLSPWPRGLGRHRRRLDAGADPADLPGLPPAGHQPGLAGGSSRAFSQGRIGWTL